MAKRHHNFSPGIEHKEHNVTEGRVYSSRGPGRRATQPLTYQPNGVRGKLARVSFELRIDDETGTFYSVNGDTWYMSNSLDSLRAFMERIANLQLDLTWERYIAVDYHADGKVPRSWRDTHGIDEPRPSGFEIHGLKLTWETYDYSSPFTPPGAEAPVRKRRDVDDRGKPSKTEDVVNAQLPVGLVPFSMKRIAMLVRMRDGLREIDAQIVEFLKGAPEELAQRFDLAVPSMLALPAGKKAKAK